MGEKRIPAKGEEHLLDQIHLLSSLRTSASQHVQPKTIWVRLELVDFFALYEHHWEIQWCFRSLKATFSRWKSLSIQLNCGLFNKQVCHLHKCEAGRVLHLRADGFLKHSSGSGFSFEMLLHIKMYKVLISCLWSILIGCFGNLLFLCL